MNEKTKDLLRAYMDWEKNVFQKYMVMIDGVEVNIPEEEDLIASFEKEAAELEVTVDYYMEEFL